jgi:NAD(P)-dependent dehydrogenase (short-subunit alcohol dehydrogenase family)
MTVKIERISEGQRTIIRLNGAAEDIAAMIVYLAGPEAGFVTGASLTIDGGFTA